jgi:hypothetical protein
MPLGYSSAGTCFATTAEAIDNYYSHPSAIVNGSNTAVYRPVKDAGIWKYERKFTDTGNTSFIQGSLNTNIYGSCEVPNDPTTQFYTGMELGWAVASAVVIAFVLRRLRRGF